MEGEGATPLPLDARTKSFDAIPILPPILATRRHAAEPFAGILLVGLAALAHFAGAAIGKQLKFDQKRHHGPLSLSPPSDDSSQAPATLATPQSITYAPTTHLSKAKSLGYFVLFATAIASLVGAISAMVITHYWAPDRVDLFCLAVAGLAFGALTGLSTFLILGFSQVFWTAWGQASKVTGPSGGNPDDATEPDSHA